MSYVQWALVGRQRFAAITASALPSRRAAGRCPSPPLDRDEPYWTSRQHCLWGHWSRALWSACRPPSRWACARLRPRARPRRCRRPRRLRPHHRRPRRLHLRSLRLPPLEEGPILFRNKKQTVIPRRWADARGAGTLLDVLPQIRLVLENHLVLGLVLEDLIGEQ